MADPPLDVLTALDEPANLVALGMLLLGMPGGVCDQAGPCNQCSYDDHDYPAPSGRVMPR